MKIQDVLKKVRAGEQLTDEEKATLESFDPQKALDAAAAAARKDEATKAAALQKQLEELATMKADLEKQLADRDNAGKTDLEKAQAQIADLSKVVNGLKDQVTSAQKEKAGLERAQTLTQIRTKAGIQFVDGLDHGMLEKSFAGAFEGVDAFDNPDVVKLKLDTWKAMNKAAILDNSGHGAGSGPRESGVALGRNGKPVGEMTPAEREEDLKKSGLI